MSLRSLVATLAFAIPSIVFAQGGTLKSSADLTDAYLLTDAGKVLGLPAKVAAKIDYAISLGDVVVSDWQGEEFCVSYGPSPNGEPELAECLEWSTKWSPKITLRTEVAYAWAVADMTGSVTSEEAVDLSKCVRDFDSLAIVQVSKPTLSLPTMIIEKNCVAYTYAGRQTSETSQKLANANVFVEVKFGSFLKITLPNDIVVKGGLVEAADQAALRSSVSYDASYTQVIFDPTLKRGGRTIRLFNYPAVVYFR